jgi:hypothetical protein
LANKSVVHLVDPSSIIHKVRPRFAFCILVLLCAAIPLIAQESTGEVNGRVISSRDNEPLALVDVQLAGTNLHAVSADDGTFHIAGVVPGNYVLQASTVDFYLLRQEFTLGAGEMKTFDVVLTPSNTRITDSVTVSTDPFEVETQESAASFTLEGDERKNLASVLADDPLKAVESVPGVTSNNDFSSEFSLRGAPFSRVGLYLDGILLHSPFHTTDGQADNGSLTIFNGDTTEDMTLYEGAWPVRYADRTAGILAVETRDGSREKVQGQFAASASNAGVLLEGPLTKHKRGSWLVDYRRSYLQYILNRIDFGDQAPYIFAFSDMQARLTYDLSARHTLTLSMLDGTSSVDRTRFRDSLSENSILTSRFRTTLFNLSSRYAPSPRLLVTNRVAWTGETGDVENRNDVALSDETYRELTWRSDATIVWHDKNTLETGAIVRFLRQNGLSNQFIYVPELMPALDAFRGKSHQAGAYAQESLGLAAGHVHVTAGVRQDEDTSSPVEVTSPYASASFDPGGKLHVQIDWGQYGQFPELPQSFSTFAHSSLLPERATHYEAAVEERINERTRIRLEFYDRQDRDLLARPELDPRLLVDGTVFRAVANAPLTNSERGYARGIQIFIQRRTANGFTGWISYAYGRAMIIDGVLGLKFPSDYDQRHTLNLYASRRLRPTVNLSARFTYGSGMPLPGFYELRDDVYHVARNRNQLRAPFYERVDLRLNKAYVGKKFKTTLFGEIVNVTNHTNRDFDTPGAYDPLTGITHPNFYTMFPILPSVGMVLEF